MKVHRQSCKSLLHERLTSLATTLIEGQTRQLDVTVYDRNLCLLTETKAYSISSLVLFIITVGRISIVNRRRHHFASVIARRALSILLALPLSVFSSLTKSCITVRVVLASKSSSKVFKYYCYRQRNILRTGCHSSQISVGEGIGRTRSEEKQLSRMAILSE